MHPCRSPRTVVVVLTALVGATTASAQTLQPPISPWNSDAPAAWAAQSRSAASDDAMAPLYKRALINGAPGLRPTSPAPLELDIGFSILGLDGADLRRSFAEPARAGLGFGPRLQWNIGAGPADSRWRLDLPLRAVLDAGEGYTARGLSFGPELVLERRSLSGWSYGASVGALVGDRRLADTYFGGPTRAGLETRPGLLAWRLGLSASRPLSTDWRLYTFARVDAARSASSTAPSFRDGRDGMGLTVGAGVTWTWMRDPRAAD
jgi:MipA family protein